MADHPPQAARPDRHDHVDVIELRGLQALAICGVLEHEKVRPQPISVDLDIEADLRKAAGSDDLADTIDYAQVAAQLEAVLTGERFSLLEHLAERLAQVVLANPGVQAVALTVRKLRPPVPQQIETTGVRIWRARQA